MDTIDLIALLVWGCCTIAVLGMFIVPLALGIRGKRHNTTTNAEKADY